MPSNVEADFRWLGYFGDVPQRYGHRAILQGCGIAAENIMVRGLKARGYER
jgi:hypothetical protein